MLALVKEAARAQGYVRPMQCGLSRVGRQPDMRPAGAGLSRPMSMQCGLSRVGRQWPAGAGLSRPMSMQCGLSRVGRKPDTRPAGAGTWQTTSMCQLRQPGLQLLACLGTGSLRSSSQGPRMEPFPGLSFLYWSA
eukprot:354555-Chlamydomonas_euryale.AAC.3